MTGQAPASRPGNKPVFLFVGRLVDVKNVAALLEAASVLKRERARFSVLIAGNGPLLSSLTARARALGLDNSVRFLGAVPYDAIGHVYATSDVFVMPSLREYRSVAVLEAMRFAMPVIDSANDGNATDAVRDGINGFVVDPHDVHGIARAMQAFACDSALIHKMGVKSAEYISSRTPETAAAALREALLAISEQLDGTI